MLVLQMMPPFPYPQHSYDDANRLLEMRNLNKLSAAKTFSRYTVDNVGNRKDREDEEGKRTFDYDKTYQLVGVHTRFESIAPSSTNLVQNGVTKTATIVYDNMGNRQSYTETYTGNTPILSKSYSHNNANEMTSDNGTTQTFDNNGNMTGRGNETLSFDSRNRLIGIHETGKDDWTASYDFTNRICSKSVGSSSETFIYDDMGRLLGELDGGTGTVIRLYSYDSIGLSKIHKVFGSRLVSETPLFDGLGSVVATVNGRGEVSRTYGYDEWGQEEWKGGDSGSPMRYTARWGTLTDDRADLKNNWNRWLDDKTGRWGSRDGLGIEGGFNLYQYGANDPVYWVDSTGLSVSYNPQSWNDNGPNQYSNNCYSYACNNMCCRPMYTKPQPGEASGKPCTNLSCKDIKAAAIRDGAVSPTNGRCPKGYHKVRLFIAPGEDYHWYRQDKGGMWSHKPGWGPVTNKDASGNPIKDPRNSDRDYSNDGGPNYSVSCGALCSRD